MLKSLSIVVAGVLAIVLWVGSGLIGTNNPTAAALTTLSPQDITESFYEWYLDYLTTDVLCNPLLDGLYHDSAYLTENLVSRIDAQVQDACGFGLTVDPFLCSSDVPLHLSTQFKSLSETDANLLLRGSFVTESDVTETRELATVRLVPVNGRWTIDDVVCR